MFAEDATTNDTIGVRIAKTRGIAVCVHVVVLNHFTVADCHNITLK